MKQTLLRYLLGVLLILAISLGMFTLLMSPPLAEIRLMGLFLLITALVSSSIGYAAYRFGWLTWFPTVRWTLLIGYALSAALTFFNVWFSARMMFASKHDLLLAIVLLVFASGMAMALGYFISSALTDRIHQLKHAADSLATGNLETRVTVSGEDEVAALGRAFNEMATRLQTANQKQRELEQMRKDLIAWASHDLQTPLASIRAILEALADGILEEPETVKRYLNTAQRDVRSLSALIDDLFQMAQLDAGGIPLDREPASLTDLVSDTLESFSELAARQNISLSGQVAADVDPVNMDTQRIGRALNNLVGNALRHTPAGGQVTLSAQRAGPNVELTVQDSGEGIRAEDLPHVFERFYRGEKSRSRASGGAGLGLAIAQGILRAHAGDIQVENKNGARFIISLPKG